MRLTFTMALCVIASPIGAQGARIEDDGIPRVVATASRSARIAPDKATIYAVIEGAAESAPEAAQRAERKLQAVQEAVRQLNLRGDVMYALPYGVMQSGNFGGYPGQSTANPFTARHIMRIQLSRMDQVMPVSAALLTAGAAAIAPPTLEATSTDSVRRVKATEALAQARLDAEGLAAGMGMRLGALIEVTTTAVPPQTGPSYVNFMRPFDSGPGQSPDVAVNVTVTVRYRLQR